MTERSQRRRIAVVICPYYPPSKDVGARRVGSIAALLAKMGMSVLVVSQSGTHSSTPATAPPGGISTVRVAPTRRLLLDKLPAIKRALLGRTSSNASGAKAVNSDGEIADGTTASGIRTLLARCASNLKLRYFTLVYLIDGHKRWSFLAYLAARRATRGVPVELVVASGPPFSSVIAAHRLARVLNAPFIADFRDPMISGWAGPSHVYHPSNWLHRAMEARVVRGARAITCTAPGLRSALAKTYPSAEAKLDIVMNGFDGRLRPPLVRTGHRLDILYAGALYIGRDPFPFLTALEALLQDEAVESSRVAVHFVGHCEEFRGRRLRDWLYGRRSAAVVEILPTVSDSELAPMIDRSTVLLNLAQDQLHQIPAKTFEHLASGREILAICEARSDTGRLLSSISGAICVEPQDLEKLGEVLRDLYRRHVVDGVPRPVPADQVQGFSRDSQFRRMELIFRTVLLADDG
jgi:Glycosyl transferase 4-like domain